jgi:hypothetical protein
MNSRNLPLTSDDDAIPSTSTQPSTSNSTNEDQKKTRVFDDDEEDGEFQPKSLPISPFYNLETELDEAGPPIGKVRRLSPKTVAEISRFDRHTILFSAMVAPSRSRVSSPVRRLLRSREPCTSCFHPTTTANENGLTHDIESE